MKIKDFNTLGFKEQLEVIYHSAIEIDDIFPWFGNLRIVRIYKLKDFFVELEYDLETKVFTNINSFKTFEYLDKYPHHFNKINNKIQGILNEL